MFKKRIKSILKVNPSPLAMIAVAVATLLGRVGVVQAQSDFDLTQRWFNESVYNPAATGNHFTTSVFLHGRAQWVGLEGAPSTQAVSFDTYSESVSSAFGLTIINDKIGLTSTFAGRLAYAYYMPLFDNKSVVSFGLSAAVVNRSMNLNDALVDDPNDPVLFYGNVSEYSPDFDFGFEFKGPFKLGAAVRHLSGKPAGSRFAAPSQNIWMYASTRFNASWSGVSIEPSVSYMYRDRISRYEAGALFYFRKMDRRHKFNDRFWLGGMFRLHGQFAVLAGAALTPKVRVGYSFDYGTGNLAHISKFGTHEIFLAWQFNRIFYKEPSCPAYSKSGYIGKW